MRVRRWLWGVTVVIAAGVAIAWGAAAMLPVPQAWRPGGGYALALALWLVSVGAACWLERRGLDRRLREHNERLTRVLDATAEGIYGVDAHGRCTFVNARALELFGYDGEASLLGSDMLQRFRPEPGATTTDGAVERALTGERSQDGLRDQLRRDDGSTLEVIHRASPLFGPGGARVVGAVASFTDCSLETQLRSSAERDRGVLSMVVDAVGEALILLDEHSRVARFNAGAERIFGRAAAEVIGGPVDRLLWECSGRELIEHIGARAGEAAGHPTQPSTRLLEGVRDDGRVFPMRVTVGQVRAATGTWVALAIQDISDEIEAEAARRRNFALETQACERRRFLSRMSHELRTPLNAVLGFTQLLRRQGEPMTPSQQRAIERIEIAGQHLLGMVNDLMDLSKLDLGGIHIEARAFDIAEEWPQAVTIVLPMARARNITIRTPHYDGAQTSLWREAGDEEPLTGAWVKADPMRVRQILVNLMTNAIKYNREDGGISVAIHQTQEEVQISVIDTGYGLTPEQLVHIGEPFNRLGAEQTGVEGSGLGLALSRNLAQAMGGELTIDSTVGCGTRATLILPRAAAQELPIGVGPAAVRPAASGAARGPGFRLLHIEDDPINKELVAGLLAHSRPDIAYAHAASGREAVAYLQAHAPDVILTDMNLGDLSGLQLLAAIRATTHGAQAPLIALSGDAMTESIDAALEAGLFAYLTKPIEFARLLATLDDAARRARSGVALA